jgi:hypothetical protein
VSLARGRSTRVTFTLSAAGAAQVAGCDSQALRVRVAAVRSRRFRATTTTIPIRPEPPACGQFFAPDSVWNQPLSPDAPLDAASDTLTATLRDDVHRGYNGGLPPDINTTAYSAPIYTVLADQPRVSVTLDKPTGQASDLARAFTSVPVPDDARPAAGTDAHMAVWQPATDTLWEFWRMVRRDDGWHAGWGGRQTNVSRSSGVYVAPVANWGATATSLSLAGGLITVAELRRGRIDHALAISLPEIRGGEFSLPAQRTDGRTSSSSAIPEGARFRVDPTLDLDRMSMPPVVRLLARAAQRYGMIVRDGGASISLYAEDPGPSGENPYPRLFGDRRAWELLRSFPWDRVQLTRMQLRPAGGAENPVVPPVCVIDC